MGSGNVALGCASLSHRAGWEGLGLARDEPLKRPDLQIVRTIKRSRLGPLAAGPSVATLGDVIVVRARSPEHAEHLHQVAQRNPVLLVERDYLLQHLGMIGTGTLGTPRSPSQISTYSTRVNFHVQDANGKPIENAEIVLYADDGTEDRGNTAAALPRDYPNPPASTGTETAKPGRPAKH